MFVCVGFISSTSPSSLVLKTPFCVCNGGSVNSKLLSAKDIPSFFRNDLDHFLSVGFKLRLWSYDQSWSCYFCIVSCFNKLYRIVLTLFLHLISSKSYVLTLPFKKLCCLLLLFALLIWENTSVVMMLTILNCASSII